MRKSAFKDLTGMTFGRLTVIGLDSLENCGIRRWKCQCSCGKTLVVAGTSLTRKRSTKSCGCISKEVRIIKGRIVDLTNRKFERLTVISRASKTSYGSATWNCICKCGNKCVVASTHLINGNTSSCGCLHKEKAAKHAIFNNKQLAGRNFKVDKQVDTTVLDYVTKSTLSNIYNRYKRDALRSNRVFSLSKDYVLKLVTSNCFYCGKIPYNISSRDHKGNRCYYTGIDRLDSNEGYLQSNVVPCCSRCNYSKNNASLNEFEVMVIDIYNNLDLGATKNSEKYILSALSL